MAVQKPRQFGMEPFTTDADFSVAIPERSHVERRLEGFQGVSDVLLVRSGHDDVRDVEQGGGSAVLKEISEYGIDAIIVADKFYGDAGWMAEGAWAVWLLGVACDEAGWIVFPAFEPCVEDVAFQGESLSLERQRLGGLHRAQLCAAPRDERNVFWRPVVLCIWAADFNGQLEELLQSQQFAHVQSALIEADDDQFRD